MDFNPIEIVHNQVAGRTRYKVAGLRRCDNLKLRLEKKLQGHVSVSRVSVSALTGNVLVSYNSDQNEKSIQALIASVVDSFQAGRAKIPRKRSTHPSPKALKPKYRSGKITNAVKASAKAVKDKVVAVAARPWHRLGSKEIVTALKTDPDSGLTQKEAVKRQKRYGQNKLPESKTRTDGEILFDQINSLPTYLLAAAAGVSLLTGGVLDAAVVLGVVAANAAIGFVTERQAEKTIHSLSHMVKPNAIVVRESRQKELPVEQVVPGDILVLKPGSYVGADCRIIDSADLTIDESMLTGESLPVSKKAGPVSQGRVALADRKNMAFMGTRVTGGQGRAIAVSTGFHTEIGKLQVLLRDTERPETPMERQLRILGDQLVLLCAGICSVVFFIGFLRGYGVIQMLRMAISLAAAAVPEGLPAAATINFALGIRNMREHKVLIRRLQAVETLGALQVVCMDKTGTITWNKMSVQQVYVGGELVRHRPGRILLDGKAMDPAQMPELMELIRVCVLCSEVKMKGDGRGDFTLTGSATENALVDLALSAGIDAKALRKSHPLLNMRHRTEQKHYMITDHLYNGDQRLSAVKGSPPEVLDMCCHYMVKGETCELTETVRREIETRNARMAGEALRILGFAMAVSGPDCLADECGPLVWLGLVGMADPIREGVDVLIERFHGAGIETVMITGDQSPTAYTVARELNLSQSGLLEILDSSDLSRMDDQTLTALAKKAHVYSRVTPADKLKIVRAIKAGGKTVAMTGDGINDGPALKAADLGIAMGKSGTDVARDVADVVLEDDNLNSLVRAVADGRGTYGNIRKSVHFFLSTNLSEIMVMFAAMAAGIGFPLNVMQLLWINIISDIFPGLALSLEKPDPDVMKQAPRRADAPLFSGADFGKMAAESAVISACSLGAYGLGLARYGAGPKTAALAFHSLTIGQLLHAYSCRSGRGGIFPNKKAPSNPYLNVAIGGSLLLQLTTWFISPIRRILGLGTLALGEMALVGGFSTLPLVINQAMKRKRSQGNALEALPGT